MFNGLNEGVTDDTVEIDAKDSKTEKLQTKYGKLILGLTIDNKRLFLQRMTPQINERLHTWLQR